MTRFSTGRRAALLGAGAALLTPILARAALSGQPGAVQQGIAFRVTRNDSRFGRHLVRFTRYGSDLHVAVDIDLEAGFGPFTVFEYRHRNREVWRDGRLVRLESQTNDDGTNYEVLAEATADGLAVSGSGGSYTAPLDTIPSSYWNPETLDRGQLLNTQKGTMIDLSVTKLARETLTTERGQVEADRYRLEADVTVEAWYAVEDRRWCGLAFEARGQDIRYHEAPTLIAESGESAS